MKRANRANRANSGKRGWRRAGARRPSCRGGIVRGVASGCLLLASIFGASIAGATGILTDPVGDVLYFQNPPPAGAPIVPDIVRVSAGYTATSLEIVFEFAPGTMDPSTPGYFFTLALDTDLDLSTGGSFVPGADKLVLFSSDLSMGTICDDILPPPGVGCGNVVSASASLDLFEFSIPLGPSGIDDDGVLRFGLNAGVFYGSAGPLGVDDAWGAADGQGRTFSVQSQAIVPEPTTATLLAVGLLGLARGRRGSHPR